MNSGKVGKTIAFLRKHYNMTQHELAQKLGVTDKAVSRWENGYGTPDISLLTKLSMILDVDIESILAGNLSQNDGQWKGLLFLQYPDDIFPIDMLYGIRIVEFQISLFLLSGIREIKIVGCERMNNSVANLLENGERYGCIFDYQQCDEGNMLDSTVRLNSVDNNLMVISQFGFVYGKDLTKLFRRIMNDNAGTGMLMNHLRQPSGISFHSKGSNDGFKPLENIYLERGMICFQIENRADLLDASNMMMILEKHNGEKIANLQEIALRRGLISTI